MGNSDCLISVVIPVYGCSSCLEELTGRVIAVMEGLPTDYEVIYVNDASPDDAWQKIKQLHEQYVNIKGINLSRNFGQHYAITAGLDYAQGDWVVVMDCDLQDRPEEIPRLYEKALTGYDVVFGKRTKRRDKWGKRYASRLFYRIYDYFTDSKTDYTVANFSISSKKVMNSFREMREQNRVFPLFLQWMGYKTAFISVEHQSRTKGKSAYNVTKLIQMATDVIIAQSNKPLRLSIQFGFLVSLISFIYGLYLFFRYFFLDQPVQGWTSVMVSIYFIGGLIFFNFGVLGLYIGKIFNETKGRPLYIVQEMVGDKEQRSGRQDKINSTYYRH
ncbi:glycosyltransferase family 2 protein [Virgibacillus sp. W0181]|uniref:glycosyltransferase family 2 protein n=1 Tax=Virgibacillus sp. W0181 TaxID=3391581 RepID=UPI003F48E3AF